MTIIKTLAGKLGAALRRDSLDAITAQFDKTLGRLKAHQKRKQDDASKAERVAARAVERAVAAKREANRAERIHERLTELVK